MNEQEISPLKSLQALYEHWWLLAALTLLGGLVGWGISMLRPAIYEARAVLTINVDYNQTGNLSPYNLDHAVGAAQAVMQAADVYEQVAAWARSQGLEVTSADFLKIFRMERRQQFWDLRVKHPDPQWAAALANTWVDRGLAALSEAQLHAQRVNLLRNYLRVLALCPPAPDMDPLPPPICDGEANLVWENIRRVQADLAAEIPPSRAISAALRFEVVSPAQVPDRPVAYQVNLLVFAGAVIGFMVGAIALSVRFSVC